MKSNLIYHPERYILSRQSRYKLEERFNKEKLDILVEARLTKEYYYSYSTIKSKSEVDEIVDIDGWLMLHYWEYKNNGKNIFHINSDLIELFKLTDVEDSFLSFIKYPYKVFYLHFGRQDYIKFGQNYFFDGAYVYQPDFEPYLKLCLTTINPNIDYKKDLNIVENPEVIYQFDLLVEDNITVQKAIDHLISSYLKTDFVLTSDDWLNTVEKEFITHLDSFQIALKLIVNSLFYITTENKDIIYRWNSKPPDSLLKKLTNSKTKNEIKLNESKINQLGYSKIYFCGESIAKEYKTFPTGKEISTHWRRGHWRNQVFGEKYSQHKLIWIKPTLVRKDKGDATNGHIYEI